MPRDPEKKREADRRYREKNREKIKEGLRAHYLANREKRLHSAKYTKDGEVRECRLVSWRTINNRKHAIRRGELILLFGGKCVRCGFDDPRALCIDHIDGGGYRDRKSYASVRRYYQAIIDKAGEGYQLLCCNCNAIKRIENKEHRRPRVKV